MDRRLFLLAGFALLGGCASAPPVVEASGPFGELEPVYAAEGGRDALTIRVASNGCTAKGDFAFHLERRAAGATLAFARKRLDSCRSFAAGHADLSFSWSELGLADRPPVFLLNPVVAWRGP